MAALKLSLIQKYKPENAYTYVYSTAMLLDGRAGARGESTHFNKEGRSS